MSYRRGVFEHERFDESLAGYAFKEDIDFSYRVVKRGYVLVQTPRARIVHHKSPHRTVCPSSTANAWRSRTSSISTRRTCLRR